MCASCAALPGEVSVHCEAQGLAQDQLRRARGRLATYKRLFSENCPGRKGVSESSSCPLSSLPGLAPALLPWGSQPVNLSQKFGVGAPQLGVRHYLCASVSPYAKWRALYTCPGVWEPGRSQCTHPHHGSAPGYHSCLGSSTALLHSPSILGCEMGTHLSWGSKRWVWGSLDSLTLSKTQEWDGCFSCNLYNGYIFCSS